MDEGSCTNIWSNGDYRAKKEIAQSSNLRFKGKWINIGKNERRDEWSWKVVDKKVAVLLWINGNRKRNAIENRINKVYH